MTLTECWHGALRLIVTEHAIERYLSRSPARPLPPGYEIENRIRAEFVRAWGRGHEFIAEDGFERLASRWKTEPLVSFIQPLSQEGPPVVLTILTSEMYANSLAEGRYVRRAA